MTSFFGSIDGPDDVIKNNNLKEIIKTATIILKLKKNKKIEDTIIKIAQNKRSAFNARVSYLKRNNESIDLFDLAGNSKKRLQVWPKGEKYRGTR